MEIRYTKAQKEMLLKLTTELRFRDNMDRLLVVPFERHLMVFSEATFDNVTLRTRVISIGPRGAVRSLYGPRFNKYNEIIESGFKDIPIRTEN